MIILFMGLPGGGKTADVVKKILDNLRLGRTVYTNVDGMDSDECLEHIKLYTHFDDYELKTKLIFLLENQVREFWLHCKPGSLIVIDEVQKFFDNRSWASEGNRSMNSWASTHRHHGFDVVLVTQHIDRIDKAVRALVEWTYEYRKITFMGSLVSQKFIKYAYSGEDVNSKPLGKNICTYDPKIFKCYKSYAGNDVKELDIMKHVNILKHPVFIILPFVLCFALYMLFGRSSLATGDLFGARKVIERSDKARAALTPQKPVIIEKREPVNSGALNSVFPADTLPKPISFVLTPDAAEAVEAPCVVVGSVIGVDDVKTEIRQCGDRVEKYVAGVLQEKKQSFKSNPVLIAKSPVGRVAPIEAQPVGATLPRPVVYKPRPGW